MIHRTDDSTHRKPNLNNFHYGNSFSLTESLDLHIKHEINA